MIADAVRLPVAGGTVWAIPSVHYRVPFAEQVARIAMTEQPSAVAVELGPEAAAAAAAWMSELGMGPNPNIRVKLRCMLGLVRPNRRLHPCVREMAERLQNVLRTDLSHLPPRLLRETLGYSSLSVLYLSPTDSLIEGVRCALELGVPLYGIDLEETAAPRRKDIQLQDPTSLRNFSLPEYVERNDAYATLQRDEIVDGRREIAMAARLKSAVRKHRNVLFICGLAHWSRLVRLLQSDDPQPAPIAEARTLSSTVYRRVIVHPILAIQHLDTFPAFAAQYESQRVHALEENKPRNVVDLAETFRLLIEASYAAHFGAPAEKGQFNRSLSDWDARSDFEQLMQNLSTLRHRAVPDLVTALQAAHGVMSESFYKTFAEKLMEFKWASPEQFPNIPILAPAPSEVDHPQRAEFVDGEGNRSDVFYIQDLPGGDGPMYRVPIPWEWQGAPPPPPGSKRNGSNSNWSPIDTLTMALAFRAIRVAREQAHRPRTEPFEGSLLAGIDIKSTLRGATRGDDRLFVRGDSRRVTATSATSDDVEGFPFVWILRLTSQPVKYTLSADDMSELRKKVPESDRRLFDRNGKFVSAVVAGCNKRECAELSQTGYKVMQEERVGQVSFQPDSSVLRVARWAVESQLKRNPIPRWGSTDELWRWLQDERQADVRDLPWHVALVRMAIALAERAVTIAAPDGYCLPPLLHEAAGRKGVELRLVPLSYFPATALRKISQIYWIPTLGRSTDLSPDSPNYDERDLPIYAEHIYRHFNEPVDVYHRLIPKDWR